MAGLDSIRGSFRVSQHFPIDPISWWNRVASNGVDCLRQSSRKTYLDAVVSDVTTGTILLTACDKIIDILEWANGSEHSMLCCIGLGSH